MRSRRTSGVIKTRGAWVVASRVDGDGGPTTATTASSSIIFVSDHHALLDRARRIWGVALRSGALGLPEPASGRGRRFLKPSRNMTAVGYGRWGVNESMARAVIAGSGDREDLTSIYPPGSVRVESKQNQDGGWGGVLLVLADQHHCGRGTARILRPSGPSWV